MKIAFNINKERKQFIRNFSSLTVLQAFNYILPLVVVPYLFSKLGVEKYGLVTYAQVVVFYIGLFVNYGFNLTGVRDISIHKENLSKVSQIYSTITCIKTIFFFLALFIFLILAKIFQIENEIFILFLFSFFILIESILFPFWLFQGLEKMNVITIIFAISKTIVTALIFIFIKAPDDYLLLPLLYLAGSIVAGIVSLIIIIGKLNICFLLPRRNQIIDSLVDGWYLFISNIAKSFYKNSNVFILGLVSNATAVGYYALAEKVIKVLQSMMGPFNDTLFPHISKTSSDRNNTLRTIFKVAKFQSIILLSVVVFVLVFSQFIAEIVSGGEGDISRISLNIKLLSFVIFFGVLNDLFGSIGLINLGHKKFFMVALLIITLIHSSLSSYLGFLHNDNGISIALTISEFILATILFTKILKIRRV